MDRNRLAEAAEHYIVSRRLSEVFFFGFALTEPRFVPLRSDPSVDCELCGVGQLRVGLGS